MVVPLTGRRALSGKPITRLNPILRVGGSEWVMLTQMLGAVREASLRVRVGNVAGKRAEISSPPSTCSCWACDEPCGSGLTCDGTPGQLTHHGVLGKVRGLR